MQSFFTKTPLFVSILLLGILSIAVFFFYREINLNNEKAESITIEVDNEIIRQGAIKSVNDSIDLVKQNRDLLKAHFAESSDIVPFLNFIESLGPQVGSKSETTTVDVLKDSSILAVNINVSGSFNSIHKILTLLENSPYELELTKVDIKKEASSEDTTLFNPENTNTKWVAVFEIKLLSFVK